MEKNKKKVSLRSESDCENSPKRIKLEEALQTECVRNKLLVEFSDDVLLLILSYLSPADLYSLSRTCQRFDNLILDHTLWEYVDLREQRLNMKCLRRFMKFFQTTTKCLALKGLTEDGVTTVFCKEFLDNLRDKSPKLTTLILEEVALDVKVKLKDFPPSLEHLALRGCIVESAERRAERSYFYGLDASLPVLKTLDLTDCKWFAPHSLLALSKSTTLEHLNLTRTDMLDCLPYASIAVNFGFSSLKILDLSFTLVGDTEVTCFNTCQSLRELVLRQTTEHGPGGLLTDASILAYGGPPPVVLVINEGLELVRGRPPCLLQRLVVSGYQRVTDISLRHCLKHMPFLEELDISHTSVTLLAIQKFISRRPAVRLIHSFPPFPPGAAP